jgi:hypothetical protein
LIDYLSNGTMQELRRDCQASAARTSHVQNNRDADHPRREEEKMITRHNILRTAQVVFIGACTMLCASTVQAATLSFHVGVNTSSIVNNVNGPFSLDFQLNGVGPATNAVTLDDFSFTGGTPTGSASLFGNATGDLGSTVSLNDSGSANNEFFQGFTAGTTEIQFDAFVTENVNPGTPDAFVMAILDNSLANIPTTAAGGDNSLLLLNISQLNLNLGNVQTAASTAPDAGVTVAVTAPTPEPGTLAMFLSGGLLAAGWISLRRPRRNRDAVK